MEMYFCVVGQGGLARHKRIHGDPKHECPQCGRLFHTPGAVTRHSLVHQAASQTCRWCTFTTTFQANLRRHCMKIHGEEYPPPSDANKRLIPTPCINDAEGKVKRARGPRPEYDNNKHSAGEGVMRRRGRPPKASAVKRLPKKNYTREPRNVIVLGESGDRKEQRVLPLHKNIKVANTSGLPNKGVSSNPQRSRIQVQVVTERSKENSMQLQVVGDSTGEQVSNGQKVVFIEEQYIGDDAVPQYEVVSQNSEMQYQYQVATDSAGGDRYEVVQGETLYQEDSSKQYAGAGQIQYLETGQEQYSESSENQDNGSNQTQSIQIQNAHFNQQYAVDQEQYEVLEGLQLQEGEQLKVVSGEEFEMLEGRQYEVVDGNVQVIGGEEYTLKEGDEIVYV